MDAKVLSFGDVLLRECDVATLESSQWLNDKIIEFYFEYLSRTLLAASDPSASAAGAGAAAGTASSSAGGESSSNGAGGAAGGAAGGEGNNSAVLLVGPSVSFWLNICPSDDDVTETMAPLGVENKEVREGSSSAVLLVGPSVTFWLNIRPSDDDVTETMAPLGVENKELIALAVNDNNDPTLVQCCSPSLPLYPLPLFLCLPLHGSSSHSQSTTTTTPHSFNAVPPHFLAILSPSLFACLCMAAHRTRSQRQQRPHTRSMHFPLTSSLSSPPLPLLASAWQLIALAVNDNNDPTLVQCCSPSLPRYPLPLSLCLPLHGSSSHSQSTTTTTPHSFNAVPPHFLSILSPSSFACLCMAAHRTPSQRQQRPHTRSMLFPLTSSLSSPPLPLLASAWQLIALAVNDNNDPTLVQCCSPSLPRYPLPLSLCLPLHGSSSHLQSTTTTTPHSFNAVPPHFLAILSPSPFACLCMAAHRTCSQRQQRPHSRSMLFPLTSSLSSPPLPLLASAWQLIALAVNDNNDPTLAEAGSHWSLLLFIRSRRLFLHFDSAGSHNLEAAKGLAEKLQALLGVTVTDDTFQAASTPQQLNGYDCGVYVLAIAKALCETASAAPEGKASAEELESSAKGVDAAAVTKLRGDVKQLIQHLGKQSTE
ncbi:unnamed protein product [Closterium sp. NIES-64]|nr:unnamed protein product [Closterium sp. NIES-64]